MEIPDTTSEKSIMEDVAYIERTNNNLIDIRNRAIALHNQADEQLALREQLQDELSSHIGENKIDVTAFDLTNQIRIERWLVDW